MDRRTLAATFFTAVFGGGAAAMIGATGLQTGSPYFDVLIYGGGAAVLLGLVGLVWLFIFAPKAKPPRPPSTTFKLDDVDGFELGEVNSSADTLADVRNTKGFSARHVRHQPSAGDSDEQ